MVWALMKIVYNNIKNKEVRNAGNKSVIMAVKNEPAAFKYIMK